MAFQAFFEPEKAPFLDEASIGACSVTRLKACPVDGAPTDSHPDRHFAQEGFRQSRKACSGKGSRKFPALASLLRARSFPPVQGFQARGPGRD